MIVNPQIGSEEQTLQIDLLLSGTIKPGLYYISFISTKGTVN